MPCYCSDSFDMRCKCFPSHTPFEACYGPDSAGWWKKPGHADNWEACPQRVFQAYDLLQNTSCLADTVTCKAAIVKPLALMGITSTEDLQTIYEIMDEEAAEQAD